MSDNILDEIMYYSRIDKDEEQEVESLKESAEQYLLNAGIYKNYQNAVYLLAVKMLTKHFYDNRDIIASGNYCEIPFGLQMLINQLQITNT